MKTGTTILAATAISLSTAVAVQAQATISGDVGLAYDLTDFENTDDSRNGSLSGTTLDGHLRADFAGWVAMLDGTARARDLDGQTFSGLAPDGASALGLHVGHEFGPAYVGAFYGRNWFQAEDAPRANGRRHGDLRGIEAEVGLPVLNGSAFAQLGEARMIGDAGDSGFDGRFVRLGMAAQVTDRIGVTVDAERGSSPDLFEDTGNDGEYTSFGVRASYRIQPRLIGEVGVETMKFTAKTEDTGREKHVYVGLRVPFGADHRPANLTTTYKPGLAAAWAEALD